ncbi:YlbF family regulator [Lactiplantibacillus carotarum]|mgnify:FL=1|uniref:YlbF family regulator n=1 Tax=Lactiplantibacillus carotarum TaxID=2993456 RepID=UPI00298F27FE|nr:YlbF family regulator [Lactiplantibacillus carotarum]
MAVNIYDTANQLEQDLRQTKEYKELQAAYATMQANQSAYDLFKDFQEVQMQLSQKQMNGEELSDEEVQKAHDLADKVGNVDEIKSLMGKERNLNQLMNDLNQIITKPVQELYRG